MIYAGFASFFGLRSEVMLQLSVFYCKLVLQGFEVQGLRFWNS